MDYIIFLLWTFAIFSGLLTIFIPICIFWESHEGTLSTKSEYPFGWISWGTAILSYGFISVFLSDTRAIIGLPLMCLSGVLLWMSRPYEARRPIVLFFKTAGLIASLALSCAICWMAVL